ncbi:unnamed protein product [Moneuplotes crassus]|uniref:BZIP domain-containing protein n=1 Tax=Euplotes crassus TaxID=5936 RepID=A0AAD1Y9N2_EUPCR|nr:unnamed protein product [Moneuplotes crassus]
MSDQSFEEEYMKKGRKRGRKRCIPEYAKDMSAEDLQKERNKRNAKKSRKKKKDYVEHLEKEIAKLSEELKGAKKIIATYKAREHLYQTGSQSGYSKLIMTQEQIKIKTEEFLKGRDSFPKDYLKYISTKFGADGTERRKVIKHAFKVIFDNLVPDAHKLFMQYNKMSKRVSREEIAAKMKKLKATKKAANELNGNEEIFYGLLLALNLDKDQKRSLAESQEYMHSIFTEYQEGIHSLVKNRNQFLRTMKKLKEYMVSTIKLLKPSQLISFSKFFRKVEHSPSIQFHELWEVNRGPSSSEETKEGVIVLSEDEPSENSDAEIPPVSESVIKSIEGDKDDGISKAMSTRNLEELKLKDDVMSHINQPEISLILNNGNQLDKIPHSDEIPCLEEGIDFGMSEDMCDYSVEGLYHSLLI